MIALKNDLPLLQFEDGRVVVFERDWLVRELHSAAQQAGHQKWWLAGHVAESVTEYLRESESALLPAPRLANAVQSVLQVIGYAEVAEHFQPQPPPVQISLLELAHEAGAGYELAFFDALGRRLRDLLATETRRLELFHLAPCVKKLRARKIWSSECDELQAEIVGFVRERVGLTEPANAVLLSLT
jgi:hypothetical protein